MKKYYKMLLWAICLVLTISTVACGKKDNSKKVDPAVSALKKEQEVKKKEATQLFEELAEKYQALKKDFGVTFSGAMTIKMIQKRVPFAKLTEFVGRVVELRDILQKLNAADTWLNAEDRQSDFYFRDFANMEIYLYVMEQEGVAP